jgi:hypothetical protein
LPQSYSVAISKGGYRLFRPEQRIEIGTIQLELLVLVSPIHSYCSCGSAYLPARDDSFGETMTKRIFERIQIMDLKELASLEANAKRLSSMGTVRQKSEAGAVLSAILDERSRRQTEEAHRKTAAKREIESKVKDLELFDRVVMAFEPCLRPTGKPRRSA